MSYAGQDFSSARPKMICASFLRFWDLKAPYPPYVYPPQRGRADFAFVFVPTPSLRGGRTLIITAWCPLYGAVLVDSVEILMGDALRSPPGSWSLFIFSDVTSVLPPSRVPDFFVAIKDFTIKVPFPPLCAGISSPFP